jgi:hypothetical protein
MKTLHYSRLLVSLLLLLTMSCNDTKLLDPISVTEEIMEDELTIKSAQQWFETKVSRQVNGRIAAQKEPMWDYAKQSVEKNGVSVVSVPVMVDEKNQSFGILTKAEDSDKTAKQLEEKQYRDNGFSTPQKLIMYKDSKGKVQTMLMKIVADFDYFENSLKKSKKEKAKNNSKDFDGTVLFYNWEETKIIEGLHYENGKLVRVFKPEKITQKGRVSGCSSWEYVEYWPPNNARVSYVCRCTVTTVTSCSFDTPESSVITVSMVSFGTGGGGASESISSSYRQNSVDNFLAQAAQNGVTFNPDERLEFIDNFDDFLKNKNDLLNKIRAWKNGSEQWLKAKFEEVVGSRFNDYEKQILTNRGPFSYRINLMIYLANAMDAQFDAGIIMGVLGRSATVAQHCSACRGNAVKHADWLIRNSNTFGTTLAYDLGIAHENNPNPNQIEKDMDLNNNQVGINLFNAASEDVANAIFNLKLAVQNGVPNQNPSGLKFVLNNQLVWTHSYPNLD